MAKKRVFVAMSGGVDSSTAAYLLKEAGYEVSGVHMLLSPDHCPEHSITDLEETCRLLDIPLYKLNFEPQYQHQVIDYFCVEYSRGRTPNPCVACNRHIKFGLLLEKVLQMGADYLATGHYARVGASPDGYRLLKGLDQTKDQSYFLYTLGQWQLQHMLLPLGDRYKAEVKKLAARLGFPMAGKPESQDVCFIADKDYRSFLAGRISLETGDIVDIEGRVLGRHNGLALYTIGQRQGLGVSSNERLYVLELDAEGNRVVVGTKDKLFKNTLLAYDLSWVSGKAPTEAIEVTAKVRYKSQEAKARVQFKNGIAEVSFHEPQRAIAIGQSVVFYQGDIILGGGIISASR